MERVVWILFRVNLFRSLKMDTAKKEFLNNDFALGFFNYFICRVA